MPSNDRLPPWRRGALTGANSVLIILAVATVVRVIVLLLSENGIDFHFNAYDRPLFTWYDWMPSSRWLPMPSYGPLHFYVLRALFLILGFDPEYLPRIASLVFGVAALWPLMRVTRRLFGAKAALWAGLAGALYPLGVRLSVVSLEVTLFLLLLLLATDAFARAVEDRRHGWKPILWAALWLNLAGATRFEAWFLIPLMALALLRVSFWRAVAFGALASVFPVFWMAANHYLTGDALNFASVSAAVQAVHAAGSGWSRAWGWPGILAATSTWPAVLGMAGGLVLALSRRRGGAVAALGLGLLAAFVVFAVRGTMALNETKYVASVAMLLLPFFGLGFAWLNDRVAPAGRAAVALGLVAVLVAFSGTRIAADNQRFAASDDVEKLCAYLAQSPPDGGKILLGVRYQGYILVHGGQPYERFSLVPGDDRTGRRSEADFWRLVDENAPCLLIHNTLPDRLDFQDLVAIDGVGTREVAAGGFGFGQVFRSGDWFVLAVERAATAPIPASGQSSQ